MKRWLMTLLACGHGLCLWPQAAFSRADSLLGTLGPLRACYDVLWYDLEVKIDPEVRRIAGRNRIRFRAVVPMEALQVDLVPELTISRIAYQGQTLAFAREARAVRVRLPTRLPAGAVAEIEVAYGGQPQAADNPPWMGGMVWRKDAAGRHRVAVACEGEGASIWYPLKDHPADEPDSMRMSFIVPEPLTVISNGTLRSVAPMPGQWTRYEWAVTYPINAYNATFYAGRYTHLHETYEGEAGRYDLDYYVFPENATKAKRHFKQVPEMLACFERAFGPYPFMRDGFALVETDYWGMEHQSAIAYGNDYQNNPFSFDFIVIHESGHEWFGNSLSCADHADLWLHESFTTYAEAVYVEHRWGHAKALQYLATQRGRIGCRSPMCGPPGVRYHGWEDSDIYFKGTWMLQTLRWWTQNDSLWWRALRGFSQRFALAPCTTADAVAYWSEALSRDLVPFFDTYLRHAALPALEFRVACDTLYPVQEAPQGAKWWQAAQSLRERIAPHNLADTTPTQTPLPQPALRFEYRWDAPSAAFLLPIELRFDDRRRRLFPTQHWQSITLPTHDSLEVDTTQALFRLRRVK